MTTNDVTPREAIADVIDGSAFVSLVAKGWEEFVGQLDNSDEIADAVIAHLWQAADDPAVVEAVDEALMEWARHPDRIIDGFDHEMRSIVAITATLTALLGPRPQESDDGQ